MGLVRGATALLGAAFGKAPVGEGSSIERRPHRLLSTHGVRKARRRVILQDKQQKNPLKSGFPTIKVETRLVNVALNVVDAKGAPVSGLSGTILRFLKTGSCRRL